MKKILNLTVASICLSSTLSSAAPNPAQEPLQWVEHTYAQYTSAGEHSELNWLKDDATFTTPEGIKLKHQAHPSWSMEMFGKQYDEWERTMSTLLCLNLIYQGGTEAYEALTLHQNASESLNRASFDRLHVYFKTVLSRPSTSLKLTETNLILEDLGKSPKARSLATAKGIDIEDHDDFLKACLAQYSELFPLFTALPSKDQKTIQAINGLIHLGHLTHLECGPEVFKTLYDSKVLKHKDSIFDIAMISQICDVAGSGAHVDNTGSIRLNQFTYQTLWLIKETIAKLACTDIRTAFDYYVGQRAQWLGFKHPNAVHAVLTRIGCMLRMHTPEEGALLEATWRHLPEALQQQLIEDFSPQNTLALPTPTYIPAVFINMRATNKESSECIRQILTHGIPFVLKVVRENPSTVEPTDRTLNFKYVADAVKVNPDVFKNSIPNYKVDPKGYIYVQD